MNHSHKENIEKKELRRLVANLLAAAGCSCCRNDDKWDEAEEQLARLLKVPKYSDGSGYNFTKFDRPKPLLLN